LSLLNVAISCTGRELYAGGRLQAYPFSSFVSKMPLNRDGDPAPIPAIVIMSVLTIPFCLFDFSFLVEWSSLLTVISQMVQIVVFVLCRVPCFLDRLKAKQEQKDEASLAGYTASQLNLVEQDETKLEGKFLIGGGWFGVVICALPVFGVAVLLCVLEGWEALLGSVAIVAAFFVIKGISVAAERVVTACRARNPDGLGPDMYSPIVACEFKVKHTNLSA
jgi:hypothetical protein